MKIKFDSVHIENFMSLGNVDVQLDDCGYTLVSGVNNNPSDLAKSNGSGKSSIFDAIMWCLTGSTIRGNKDIVNIHSNDGAVVDLSFIVDRNNYHLIRSKNHSKYKTNLKIYIDDVDKSGKGVRDSEQLLKEYLPDLTASLVGSVIILGQGLPERFTNNTPSGRKEVLEKLCKSDFMIQELKDKISRRKDELTEQIRTIEDSALVISTQIEMNKRSIQSKEDELNNLIINSNFDEQVSSILDELQDMKLQQNEVSVMESEQQGILNQANSALSAILQAKSDTLEGIHAEYKDKLNQFNTAHIDAKMLFASAKSELDKLLSIKDTCPTCGQKLPGVSKPDTTAAKQAVAEAEKSVSTAYSAYTACNEQYCRRLDGVKSDYQDKELKQRALISEMDKQYKVTLQKLSQLNSYTSSLNSKLEKVKSIQEAYKSHTSALENEIKTLRQSINDADNSLLYKYKERDDLQVRLGVINKFNTIVARDFRGYLLGSIIEFIDTRAKQYCEDIFENNLVNFSLDGNNISISYDSKEYESLSGGEKQKVDLIIQFAIRDMLCSYVGFSTNIVALDEIFDNLDEIGCSKVINLISTKLIDISSIFIITHHGAELNIPCDNEIVVVKGADGISYLQ